MCEPTTVQTAGKRDRTANATDKTLGHGNDYDEEDEEDGSDDQNTEGELELWDATVKLLRLLANLCIDETIGVALARRPEALQVIEPQPVNWLGLAWHPLFLTSQCTADHGRVVILFDWFCG